MLINNRINKGQTGFTLVEALIGIALSMIVVTSMVGVMSNSLGSASRIIQMTQLSDDLRNTMSMVTRDMRRANYNANAYRCYANSDCGTDGSTNQSGTVFINADNDCLLFNIDRNQDGDGSTDGAGGFRRSLSGTTGFIEMWVGGATPGCTGGHVDWIALTDPEFVDVTTFNIDDSASITGSILEEGGGTLNLDTRQVKVQIVGQLILDRTITRSIEDTIKVRNDYLWRSP
ncbi:MAG: prepilin-type N-terminal cleavage/methylation domain-containing protein [Xanthomonadales bacterium]|nr:prepilin-type N-terminal cleavage/methylation domain-containing protein [Xanthomonadales bacterium]MDH4001339.1 prepilin-type N-terminal cleavage/methylation domain-containing protein [Xanthomonadales bacterium]